MLTRNQLGVLYGVASVACFAMMDACVKWLDQFPVGEVLFVLGKLGYTDTAFLGTMIAVFGSPTLALGISKLEK